MSEIPLTSPLKTLSASSAVTLKNCPRKYYLSRSSETMKKARESNQHLAYGSAYGEGVQELLDTGDLTQAIWKAFLAFDYAHLYDTTDKRKSFFWCVRRLEQYHSINLPQLAGQGWKMAQFEGLPAREVHFAVDLEDGVWYRGKIDCVLQRGRNLLVLEIKTSGAYKPLNTPPDAVYRNSPQGLIYALVVQAIAQRLGLEAETGVLYMVSRTRGENTPEVYYFEKRRSELKEALVYLVALRNQVLGLSRIPHAWPKSGDGCGSCPFYRAECDHTKELVFAQSPAYWEDEKVFTFSFGELMKVVEGVKR